MKRLLAGTYRRFLTADDAMVRGSMPTLDAVDPKPTDRRVVVTVASTGTARLVRVVPSLRVTVADLAKAAR